MKIAPVSGDLLLKLAIIAGAGLVAWYVVKRIPNIATAAGNATADTATGAVHSVATGLGSGLVGAVNAVPGLTDYLKSISDSSAVPGESFIPATAEVNGQLFNWGY